MTDAMENADIMTFCSDVKVILSSPSGPPPKTVTLELQSCLPV